MDDRFRSIVFRFLGMSLVVLFVLLGVIFFLGGAHLQASLVGYFLSFVFVGSNFIVLHNFHMLPNSVFNKRFFISLGVRFLLVLVAFVTILQTIKIHLIYFTVSFIISYICHSLIEIILINKLLETDN